MAVPRCQRCGAEPREGARFCDACGSALIAAPTTAAYKQVTALFADVVRSMDIAAALDPERYREVMTDLLGRAADVARRYGGTVEFTGDGVMAVFGAPIALEDHAFRGCLAGLAIQSETRGLATEVARRDGVDLRVRVGLNSGRVIAGEIDSGSQGYRVTGSVVGLAQRMESVAPAGEVMLSEATARLVEQVGVLAPPELVRIKGADEPVRAYRLVSVGHPDGLVGRGDARLVGRRWEMAALDAGIDRAIGGHGEVVHVVGPPGVGKSRIAREVAARAAVRGAEVVWVFCESHARDIPFHVVTRLLRSIVGVTDLDAEAARARIRAVAPAGADPQDLLLFDDLLGVADPAVALPLIDSDARRRRLTALINAASLARGRPVLIVIDDAHWIDAVSDSMIADFLSVISRTRSMVLITARPEYRGALTEVSGTQIITLASLGDSDIQALLAELIGSDPSVSELAATIVERAAGNPFFTEEMVRELALRGVLSGERGEFVCGTRAADVEVPATVEAAIEARLDRLSGPAKRALDAASVIGMRFEIELLTALGVDAAVDELVEAELIEQVRSTPTAEYAFCHPLIAAVAGEAQLRDGRAEWHRRLAAAIEERDPASVDENAVLIAEHLYAAGDLLGAYAWHMRAAAWLFYRDTDAARSSCDRARGIADELPGDDPLVLSMRIAPRTLLSVTLAVDRTKYRAADLFAELQDLCDAAGDKVSRGVGMVGCAVDLLYDGRVHEAARVAAEQMELLDSVEDSDPLMATSTQCCATWFEVGEFDQMLRWSQRVIDLAGGDPARGAGYGNSSPLALGLVWRGMARYWLGLPGWRQDMDEAVEFAGRSDPVALSSVRLWTYGFATYYGVLLPDESVVELMEDALRITEAAGNDAALSLVQFGLGAVLLSSDSLGDRRRGIDLLAQAREVWIRRQVVLQDVLIIDMWIAMDSARSDHRDAALPVMRRVVDDLYESERPGYGVWAIGVLVETLIERGTEADLAEAEHVIDRLVRLRSGLEYAVRDITVLRLRTLLARARGDVAFRELAGRYRALAGSLGFEGHIAWADSLAT